MKTQKNRIPDKTIKCEFDDRVDIYGSKDKIEFHVFVDREGMIFSMTRKEIEEVMK